MFRHTTHGNLCFLYVAHYAPHLPLQAPAEYVKRCIDRYKVGYDVLRKQRFEKQKRIGLIPDNMELPVFNKEFGGKRPAWEELTPEQQNKWIKDMATYAAMIEIMDEGIGKLVEEIKKKGIPIVYSGSLFQQDYGENVTGHGYVVWNVEDLKYSLHEVKNDYSIYKFSISSYDDIDEDVEKLLNY